MNDCIAPRKTAALALAVALVLAGCGSALSKNEAPGPAAQATGLAPQQARITDERILSDRRTLDAVQQRLRKLNESGIPQGNYSLAKARSTPGTRPAQADAVSGISPLLVVK